MSHFVRHHKHTLHSRSWRGHQGNGWDIHSLEDRMLGIPQTRSILIHHKDSPSDSDLPDAYDYSNDDKKRILLGHCDNGSQDDSESSDGYEGSNNDNRCVLLYRSDLGFRLQITLIQWSLLGFCLI